MVDYLPFENKVALVTGSARGIGRAIAETLASRGASLVIADLRAELAASTAQEIAASTGQRTLAVAVDVVNSDSVKAMVDRLLAEFGRLDILVNNAGITRDNLIMRMEEADWDLVLNINLKGAFNCCKALVRTMMKQRYGRIVNIASVAGITRDNLIMRMEEADWDLVLNINLKGAFNCSKAVVRTMMKQRYGRIVNIASVSGLAGQAGQANYSASKAGLIGMTKALARELGSRQITVNAVAPGFIPTDLTKDLPTELKDASLKMIPLGRWGSTQDIAAAVAFLASDEAAYVTGHVLSVDGGMVMM